MRRLGKRSTAVATPEQESRPARALQRRIRADLRRRGVPAELLEPIAARIAPQAEGLDAVRYGVLLDGAAAAHAARPASDGGAGDPAPAELQRLVQDFAVELKKLDEGLRLLSTYLLRIRDRTTQSEHRTLH